MAPEVDRDAVTRLMEGRRNPPDEQVAVGNERVDIELVGIGNGPFRVRKKGWEWTVDEPPERGGTDSAANPLAYFLSGAATCLLSHYMLYAISEDVAIDAIELLARMRFDRRVHGGRITEVIYDIEIGSSASGEAIQALAERAQDSCYAHNTLAAAGVALTANLRLNGQDLATLTM
jgi:uncharacterized OsmC-like protein